LGRVSRSGRIVSSSVKVAGFRHRHRLGIGGIKLGASAPIQVGLGLRLSRADGDQEEKEEVRSHHREVSPDTKDLDSTTALEQGVIAGPDALIPWDGRAQHRLFAKTGWAARSKPQIVGRQPVEG
jgi:hypothetical protein